MSLQFSPLYWIFHDQWAYRTWGYSSSQGWQPTIFPHKGHCHFFMLNHATTDGQQAYSGNQTYLFSLDEKWGPNSPDPNQDENVRIVGSPKWYFKTREVWRRVYIQDWHARTNAKNSSIVGKKGLAWDASGGAVSSSPEHTFGPFREGSGSFFMWTKSPRTLPIEYFHDESMAVRDHFLRTDPEGYHIWNTTEAGFEDSDMLIPRTFYAGRPGNHAESGDGPTADNAARVSAYPDSTYMWPTIEYQIVDRLDWDRLPGWEDRDASEDSFGDGLSVEVSLPYSVDGLIQSPFSDNDGNVSPFGYYHHDFDTLHPERIPRHRLENDPLKPEMYDIPEELLGQPMVWTVPDHLSGLEDGVWVEQFLGGIVRGRAKVTLEDNFGGRKDVWVNSTQFMVREDFAGRDQNYPAAD